MAHRGPDCGVPIAVLPAVLWTDIIWRVVDTCWHFRAFMLLYWGDLPASRGLLIGDLLEPWLGTGRLVARRETISCYRDYVKDRPG